LEIDVPHASPIDDPFIIFALGNIIATRFWRQTEAKIPLSYLILAGYLFMWFTLGGTGRYPDMFDYFMQPCDVSRESDILYSFDYEASGDAYVVTATPRKILFIGDSDPDYRLLVRNGVRTITRRLSGESNWQLFTRW
jgi:hypothetical protein